MPAARSRTASWSPDRRLAEGLKARRSSLSSLYFRRGETRALRQCGCAGGLHRPVDAPPIRRSPPCRGRRARHGDARLLRAMGASPQELRLNGGAARSGALRSVISAAIGAPVRISSGRRPAPPGGHDGRGRHRRLSRHGQLHRCWVTPLLGAAEAPDRALSDHYTTLFPAYAGARHALSPVWDQLAEIPGPAEDGPVLTTLMKMRRYPRKERPITISPRSISSSSAAASMARALPAMQPAGSLRHPVREGRSGRGNLLALRQAGAWRLALS